jgi:hypothetical protein
MPWLMSPRALHAPHEEAPIAGPLRVFDSIAVVPISRRVIDGAQLFALGASKLQYAFRTALGRSLNPLDYDRTPGRAFAYHVRR